jgi:hypothetical protein
MSMVTSATEPRWARKKTMVLWYWELPVGHVDPVVRPTPAPDIIDVVVSPEHAMFTRCRFGISRK